MTARQVVDLQANVDRELVNRVFDALQADAQLVEEAFGLAQRENTKRAILNSFGEILYNRGLSGLTMTDVAKNAGIGRTAVYNYFADMGELLVAYALDETERFLNELRVGPEAGDGAPGR